MTPSALGAVPKELGTSKVRLIHDGAYSVDVNRRICVRDRMRFPLIDDAAAILLQVREEKEENKEIIRFSVLYDIARAHKLIPLREEDWGLQAFRLLGEATGDVFVHTRGTFGIASAAYWSGRAIGVVARCSHRIMGRHMGLRKPTQALEPLLTCPNDIFRVDAKAAGEEIVIGGWETWKKAVQKEACWFSFRLNRKNAACKGDPFRSIATLELIGALAAVMVFSPAPEWGTGDSAVTLSALTDNLGNTHVLKKFGSSKYPLSVVAMELASQLDRRGIDLDLQWVPR